MSRSKQEVTQMIVVAHERARQKLAFDAVIKQARFNNYKRTHAKKKKRYQSSKNKKRASLQKDAILDPFVTGPAVGGAIGLLRERDPLERRRDAVIRSAGTGAATGAGTMIGSGLGGALGYLAPMILSKLRGSGTFSADLQRRMYGGGGDEASRDAAQDEYSDLAHRMRRTQDTGGMVGTGLGALLGGLSGYSLSRREKPKERMTRLGDEEERDNQRMAIRNAMRGAKLASAEDMEKDAIFEQLGSLAARAGRGVLGMPGIKRIPGAGDAGSYFSKLLSSQAAQADAAKRLATQTTQAGRHQRAGRGFVEQLKQRIFPGRETLRTNQELVRSMGGGFPTRQAVTDVLAERGLGRRAMDAFMPSGMPGSLAKRVEQRETALAMQRLGHGAAMPEATGAGLRNLGIGTALGMGGLGYAAT